VELLLDAGADVDARGGLNGNALQTASCQSESIAKLLLTKGANVNAKGGFYASALHAASYAGYEELVKMLLAKGADVNLKLGKGQLHFIPLQLTVRRQQSSCL
jgi:ankyrin repeat protein